MSQLSVRFLALRFFFTPQSVIVSLLLSFVFFVIAAGIANLKNVSSILSSPYTIYVKVKLLSIILLEGTFSSMSPVDAWFLVCVAILFGLNASLVIYKIKAVRKGGRLSVVFGTGLFSVISAGCASCGLSAASLLGLGGALAFLPFHGAEFYVVSIIILLVSLYVNLGTFAKACKITSDI